MKNKILKILAKFKITPHVYYTYKHNDPFVLKEKLFKNKPITIFDVGAHDGRSIDLYKKKFPRSKVYSFEPTPEIFTILEKNYSFLPDIKVFNIALTSFIGKTKFYINNSSFTNSLLELSSNNELNFLKNKTSIDVDTNSIDNFCNENNIDKISILKIDVQGADLEVLKGAEQMLRNKKIDLIFIEVEFVRIYKDQPLYHDISLFLSDFNYKLFSLYNLSYSKEGQIVYGDATFILEK